MESDSVESLTPERLARLLEIESEAEGGGGLGLEWNDADGAAALRDQLRAPLVPEVAGDENEAIRGEAGGLTMLAALRSRETSVELLESIKQYGREMRQGGAGQASPLRGGPGTVIYYAAIAAALMREKAIRISTLADEQLQAGFAWAVQQAGAEDLREIFAAALRKMGE